MKHRNLIASIAKSAAVMAAAAVAALGAASANVINIAGGNGVITCTGSLDPACHAFAFGASGGLGTEPDGSGTLIDGSPATEVAWYYNAVPSNEASEAARLNILTGGATSFDMTDATKDESPSLSFSTLAAYVVLKLGDTAVFLKNTSGGWLTVTLSDLGEGFGLSHVTEFGETEVIPIPGAIWLMLAGVFGLGAASRKKKAL